MSRDPLPEWNRTELEYPRRSTIAELFKKQAKQFPNAIAVIAKPRHLSNGENTYRKVSYREIDERSDRVAIHLQSLGVKAEARVGIFLGRTDSLIVGMLGILKAGGAYVPLDLSYPTERIEFMIRDSEMSAILTSVDTRARLPKGMTGLTVVDIDAAETDANDRQEVQASATADNLAYVIYTSGSTGKPKGVMVAQRSVVNFFSGMDRAIGPQPGVWLAVTGIAFDISVLELLWTLTRGFTVVMHGDEKPAHIAEEIEQNGVTHLQMTPSLARMLTLDARAFAALGKLRKILLGGEVAPASLISKLREKYGGEIYNMYGPTETTIWSTTHLIVATDGNIPIGRPIANTQIHLLNDALRPVGIGETGEIFIGGEGMARGYWKQEQLTAEKFLVVPSVSPDRLYRTGDLARYLENGVLEFVGRADFQIKLRGHRVELGEIEALLEQCSGVSQAVVVAREERAGDKRLVAYVVREGQALAEQKPLQDSLRRRLPEAVIPSAFVFLSALPLTANGKIDRNALIKLPPPDRSSMLTSAHEGGSELEQTVAQAWQEALGVAAVGINDNFFDMGAHSLTVAEVQSKLQNALEREILLVDLYEFSTVRLLAQRLAGTQPQTSVSDRAQRRKLARLR